MGRMDNADVVVTVQLAQKIKFICLVFFLKFSLYIHHEVDYAIAHPEKCRTVTANQPLSHYRTPSSACQCVRNRSTNATFQINTHTHTLRVININEIIKPISHHARNEQRQTHVQRDYVFLTNNPRSLLIKYRAMFYYDIRASRYQSP